jgi:hypothetical protein
VLADKLHTLLSIELDLRENRAIWPTFNAPRDQVLDYYRKSLDALATGDARLLELADNGRRVLAAIEALESAKTGEDSRLDR